MRSLTGNRMGGISWQCSSFQLLNPFGSPLGSCKNTMPSLPLHLIFSCLNYPDSNTGHPLLCCILGFLKSGWTYKSSRSLPDLPRSDLRLKRGGHASGVPRGPQKFLVTGHGRAGRQVRTVSCPLWPPLPLEVTIPELRHCQDYPGLGQ